MRRGALLGVLAICACYGGKIDPNGSLAAGSTGHAEPGDGSTGASDDPDDPPAGSTDGPPMPDPEGTTGASDLGEDSSSGGGDDDDDDETTASESTGGEPATGCDAQPDALLCEDFEAGLSEDQWEVDERNGATVTVEDGMLHVNLGAADGAHGFIELQPGLVFPVDGNHVFGRVRMRTEPAVPDRHCYILNASGQLDGAVARYRLDVNGGTLNSRYTHNPTVEQHGGWRKYGRDAEVDAWTCVEWEFDGQTNSMRYWFDGELDAEMEVDGAIEDPPWVAPDFDFFEIGYHTYQAAENGENFDFWFDDLVLATERVGC